MSRYHLRRRRRQFQVSNHTRIRKQFPSSSQSPKESTKSSRIIKNYEHPYATRSKTSRHSSLPSNGTNDSDKNTPDSNVIYLGAYRKIPRFIDLENNEEKPQHIALIDKFEPNFKLKVEKMDYQHDEGCNN